MRTHGEGTQKEKKKYGKRNEMYNSRQTEYNVQQAGELHKSGVGGKKQKCIEAGTENAEVGAEVTYGGRLFQTSAPETAMPDC